jgi:type I restriction-modification system DNA methylase subunit
VFSDFIEISAIAISNRADLSNFNSREKRYFEIIKDYSKQELDLFTKMFAELVNALSLEMTDVLGELFMELELGSKWKGQFFTPMSICELCGSLIAGDYKKIIDAKGFIQMSEPAVGGGAMIIGVAKALMREKINYQKSMIVTAVDLDLKAVHMCYVQLALLSIPAIVCHGNTLTVEVFSQWKTPIYILDGWDFKKTKEPKKKPEYKALDNGQLSMII